MHVMSCRVGVCVCYDRCTDRIVYACAVCNWCCRCRTPPSEDTAKDADRGCVAHTNAATEVSDRCRVAPADGAADDNRADRGSAAHTRTCRAWGECCRRLWNFDSQESSPKLPVALKLELTREDAQPFLNEGAFQKDKFIIRFEVKSPSIHIIELIIQKPGVEGEADLSGATEIHHLCWSNNATWEKDFTIDLYEVRLICFCDLNPVPGSKYFVRSGYVALHIPKASTSSCLRTLKVQNNASASS